MKISYPTDWYVTRQIVADRGVFIFYRSTCPSTINAPRSVQSPIQRTIEANQGEVYIYIRYNIQKFEL